MKNNCSATETEVAVQETSEKSAGVAEECKKTHIPTVCPIADDGCLYLKNTSEFVKAMLDNAKKNSDMAFHQMTIAEWLCIRPEWADVVRQYRTPSCLPSVISNFLIKNGVTPDKIVKVKGGQLGLYMLPCTDAEWEAIQHGTYESKLDIGSVEKAKKWRSEHLLS